MGLRGGGQGRGMPFPPSLPREPFVGVKGTHRVSYIDLTLSTAALHTALQSSPSSSLIPHLPPHCTLLIPSIMPHPTALPHCALLSPLSLHLPPRTWPTCCGDRTRTVGGGRITSGWSVRSTRSRRTNTSWRGCTLRCVCGGGGARKRLSVDNGS